eukprot:4098793-Ditylum_brightwellii.AAC.1
MQQLLTFLLQADPDTMQYHPTMKEPGREQFIEAIVQEVNTHAPNISTGNSSPGPRFQRESRS